MELVPLEWFDKKNFKLRPDHGFDHAVTFPWWHLLGLTFAVVGRAYHKATESIAEYYLEDASATGDAESKLDGLSDVARRTWIAIAFAAENGWTSDPMVKEDWVEPDDGKTKKRYKKRPASAGADTYAWGVKGAGLDLEDIVDLGSAISGVTPKDKDQKFMISVVKNRVQNFHRLLHATKAALIATALEDST